MRIDRPAGGRQRQPAPILRPPPPWESPPRFRAARSPPGAADTATLPRFCAPPLGARIGGAGAARAPPAAALGRHVSRALEIASPAAPLVNRRSITFVSKRVG